MIVAMFVWTLWTKAELENYFLQIANLLKTTPGSVFLAPVVNDVLVQL